MQHFSKMSKIVLKYCQNMQSLQLQKVNNAGLIANIFIVENYGKSNSGPKNKGIIQ